ncbi:hypothetical protein BDV12DRAFT_170488 [Aspergillus spectabilis]
MDPFTQLPPELIVKIIVRITDFSAAESIILASPWVKAVFQGQPTIIQELIQSDPITSLPEIQKLLHDISLIQTSLVQCDSLTDYQLKSDKTTAVEYTEELLTCIIHLAARTQRLACACLALIQSNFVSALSKCEVPTISVFDRVRKASEPFSFTEEYRVYSSLWHLQHYSSLRQAATGRWGWDEMSIQGLDAYTPWNKIYYQTGTEKIWTTAALLSDLGLTPIYGHHPFQHHEPRLAQDPEGEESSRGSWSFPEHTPLPFFPSFDLPPAHDISHPSRIWASPPPPDKTEGTEAWCLIAERRTLHPRQCMLFSRASSSLTREREPISQAFVDFRPWRRLGMPIWDEWRMYKLGLFNFPRNGGEVIPTPDGGILDVYPRDPEERARVPLVDYPGRLLGLIGARRPREKTQGYIGGFWVDVVP